MNPCRPKIRSGSRRHEFLSSVLPRLDASVDLAAHHLDPGTCFLLRVYRILRSKPPSRFRGLISIDSSPYVRLVWLRAQTPGMLDFYSAFVWAWLQPTRPSSLALALDWSTCTEAQVCATRLHRGVCAPRVHNDGQPNPKLRFDRA